MKKPHIVAIIQARMASTRLPNKVLLDIGGQPMLVHVVERTRLARTVDQVVVATTDDPTDQAIVDLCEARGYPYYRGSVNDVLDRYYQAARLHKADVIVRITADCPLIDPELVDELVTAFLEQGGDKAYDFGANRLPPPWGRSYPIGLDTEACTFQALEIAWNEAELPHQREHVMPFFYEQPERFHILHMNHEPDYGALRWTVDTSEDLHLVRQIFEHFSNPEHARANQQFGWLDVLTLFEQNPALKTLNAKIKPKDYREVDQRLNPKPYLLQVKCPLCKGMQTRLFDQRTLHGYTITNRVCTGCGLVFQSPRMSDQELALFYESEYRQLYQGSQEPSAKDIAVQRSRAKALVAFAKQHINMVTRHLDIGASVGCLLQAFQQAYGCVSIGVEPDRSYTVHAHSQGLQIFHSLDALREEQQISENNTLENRFDLISMAHVLEHIPNPVEYLVALRDDWLTRDGYLLIEVPNLYCHDCFEIAHLVSFSPHTLIQILQMAGFIVVAGHQHGLPRSAILPLYLTVLAHPSTDSVPPKIRGERWVKTKRDLGLLHREIKARLFPDRAWIPVVGLEI